MHATFNRRTFTFAAACASLAGWLGRIAVAHPKAPKFCVLLWMADGTSHIDTFDPKPDAPVDRGGIRCRI